MPAKLESGPPEGSVIHGKPARQVRVNNCTLVPADESASVFALLYYTPHLPDELASVLVLLYQ